MTFRVTYILYHNLSLREDCEAEFIIDKLRCPLCHDLPNIGSFQNYDKKLSEITII